MSPYAQREFAKEYRHILAPDFLDRDTRSAIEQVIDYEIYALQKHRSRYAYRSDRGKERAQQRRAQDVGASMGRLYSQLTVALSKHEVLIRDLAALPQGTAGGIVKSGVYAGGN